MLKKILVLILILIAFPSVSLASEPGLAKNSLAHEHADCAAYYIVLIRDAERHNKTAWDKKNTDALAALAKATMGVSMGLSSGESAVTRIRMTTKTLLEDMDYDWSNIATVMNKYMYVCHELIN